jgi:hypothetical protein
MKMVEPEQAAQYQCPHCRRSLHFRHSVSSSSSRKELDDWCAYLLFLPRRWWRLFIRAHASSVAHFRIDHSLLWYLRSPRSYAHFMVAVFIPLLQLIISKREGQNSYQWLSICVRPRHYSSRSASCSNAFWR